MKKTAGVRIENDVSFNPRPKITIRGVNYGTLLMLDGVILSDLEGEARILNQITLYDIERVEVARGAYSSLYGAGAIGGAVHFITSMPKDFEVKTLASYGSELIEYGAEKNEEASFNYTEKSISISNVTSDQDNQTDVLLAVSDETLATNVPISFGFRHALSMIKFTLTSKIGDIAISDFTVSGFKSTGTVTMTDADEISWTVQDAPSATFTLDDFTATTKGASSNEFVVIPQSGVNLKVTFKAVIDGIEKTLTADMPNQSYGNSYRYNYTAEITGADMDVIQFNAPVVSDWEDYTDVTIDVNKTN